MKFTSLYVPRSLRKVLKQKNSDNTYNYAQNDLSLVNNASQVHLTTLLLLDGLMMVIQSMVLMGMTERMVALQE